MPYYAVTLRVSDGSVTEYVEAASAEQAHAMGIWLVRMEPEGDVGPVRQLDGPPAEPYHTVETIQHAVLRRSGPSSSG
jgi:hypothetical protein